MGYSLKNYILKEKKSDDSMQRLIALINNYEKGNNVAKGWLLSKAKEYEYNNTFLELRDAEAYYNCELDLDDNNVAERNTYEIILSSDNYEVRLQFQKYYNAMDSSNEHYYCNIATFYDETNYANL
jgi:hypothetical protein